MNTIVSLNQDKKISGAWTFQELNLLHLVESCIYAISPEEDKIINKKYSDLSEKRKIIMYGIDSHIRVYKSKVDSLNNIKNKLMLMDDKDFEFTMDIMNKSRDFFENFMYKSPEVINEVNEKLYGI